MTDAAQMLIGDPRKLAREALGLAGLCAAILAALFLAGLA
jgi:hypothetical protein